MLQMAAFIFYGWAVSHCMYICIHVYSYCLSVDRHLGCFRILVMLLWTLGCIFLFKLVFSFIFFRYRPRSRVPWSYGSSVFGSIWGTSILFTVLAASIYIPTNSVKGFSFLPILTNIRSLWPFWWQPLWLVWGVRWSLMMVLMCVSLTVSDAEHLSVRPVAICKYKT